MKQETIPQTISTSYGDDEQSVPLDYAISVCNMFAQLGTMGIGVLFASGDSGVGGGSCRSKDGKGRKKFIPVFPASCGCFYYCNKYTQFTRWRLQGPFVTTVGGTTQVNPEVATNFSGGGFSNYFARPSYQSRAVSSYLQNIGSQYSGLFKWACCFDSGDHTLLMGTMISETGRGYPDISAQAENFQIVYAGKVENTYGTSCSAPVLHFPLIAPVIGLQHYV
jgi:tripeptidyl-peptidase-1